MTSDICSLGGHDRVQLQPVPLCPRVRSCQRALEYPFAIMTSGVCSLGEVQDKGLGRIAVRAMDNAPIKPQLSTWTRRVMGKNGHHAYRVLTVSWLLLVS